MKTAMQELIDEMCSINWHLYSFNDKMKVVNVYLVKEKEQILKAYEDGADHGMDVIEDGLDYIVGIEYYNKNYNQNK
jgi:hypothetical protein